MMRINEYDDKISIRLSSDQLKELDKNINSKGFKNRAEVIRKLILYFNKNQEIPTVRKEI